MKRPYFASRNHSRRFSRAGSGARGAGACPRTTKVKATTKSTKNAKSTKRFFEFFVFFVFFVLFVVAGVSIAVLVVQKFTRSDNWMILGGRVGLPIPNAVPKVVLTCLPVVSNRAVRSMSWNSAWLKRL